MEQVFLNLLNNAFDSMAGRDVPGILEIRTSLVNDEKMQIEFIDNGYGIKDEEKERLFEPFFTTKQIGKGTGLGLSISYGIVKEHGGDLYLDDAHYCGAKFVVTLPVVCDLQSFDEPKQSSRSSAWSKLQGKVLVVDDEDVVADVIDAALSVKGFSVDCAATGEEAYQMIGSGEYDLVISDIRMPGVMDGRRLYYEVREQNPDLAERFVFISGDVMEKSTSKFLNECGRAYLLKPFSLADLRDVIEKTLNLPES
jgi:two-component system NtrC family sensor kinase